MDLLKSALELLSSQKEPKKAPGKFTPVNLRQYNNAIDTSAKRSSTNVVPVKMMSEKAANVLQAKKNKQELARRQQAIAVSEAAKNKPFSTQQLAEETGAIGDKLRLFPNDPNSIIDEYLNPGVMIGKMASGVGAIPEDLKKGKLSKAALSVAEPLLLGALGGLGGSKTKGQFLNEILNPVAGVSSPIKDLLKKTNIDAKQFMDILRNGKSASKNVFTTPEINEVTSAYRQDIADLLSPEGQKRLKNLGINVEEFNKNRPELKFMEHRGSFSLGTHPAVTERPGVHINTESNKDVIRRLNEGMTQKDVIAHEIGHTLQTAKYKNSPEFKKRLDFYNQHIKDIEEYPNYSWLKKKFYDPPVPLSNFEHYAIANPVETSIDKAAEKLIPKENLSGQALKNLNYFNYKEESLPWLKKQSLERLPFLREMRSNMKSKGYINHIYDEIPESVIEKYLKENPTNRISSAFKNNPENRKLIADIMKVLPAVGAGVSVKSALDQEKKKK